MASFRQMDEHHIPAKASILEWNPKMDLIALANVQGKVVLHRLSWQKVWILQPPGGKEKEVKVLALAWRPDGRVLAVAYDTGIVNLCDVENSETLETINVDSNVTALTWNEMTAVGSEDNLCYQDNSSQFLPKLPPLSKTYSSVSKQTEENAEDSKKLKDQSNLNILAIATEDGTILLYAFGVFPCGKFDINTNKAEHNLEDAKIVSLSFSDDLNTMSVFVETKDANGGIKCHLLTYEVPLIKHKHRELHIIALKYGQIMSLLNYMAITISAISEAWEDILLEIDSKLTNYAEEKHHSSSGTVSDDFLELLMFGTPSDSLEKFLLHDLTEKGLKKLGHSIELSYSNIQKLVLKHLQCVTQSLFYHFNDLKGMTLWQDRFSSIGLNMYKVEKAAALSGSFLMKATEIQQVIDSSMKNFKAFFRWLYAVILRLSDEPISPEITKVTLQDLNFVANFLRDNFATEWNQEEEASFSLERVGQYLKDQDLPFPTDTYDNPWVKFIRENPDIQLQFGNILFPHYPQLSLVQQHELLKEAIMSALHEPSKVISKCITHKLFVSLFVSPASFPLKLSHIFNSSDGYLYTAFTEQESPATYLSVIRQNLHNGKIEGLHVTFGASEGSDSEAQKLIDFQFYNEELITLLLLKEISGQPAPVLGQLPMKFLVSEFQQLDDPSNAMHNIRTLDAKTIVDVLNTRVLESMKASSIAVSGPRKVACVVFASRRHVQVFDMDVDDDEEDQEDGEQDSSTKCQGSELCADKTDVMDSQNEGDEEDKVNDV